MYFFPRLIKCTMYHDETCLWEDLNYYETQTETGHYQAKNK